MKIAKNFLACVGIGVLVSVVAKMCPNWNDFAWWMGGAICVIITDSKE